MHTINQLLDKAKQVNNLPSDYKLAIVAGISHGSVNSYRAGKTLPDERVIQKLCDLSGDDAEILYTEFQAQRAKDEATKAFWQRIAHRLQSGATHAAALALCVVVLLGAVPRPAAAEFGPAFIMLSYFVAQRLARRLKTLLHCPYQLIPHCPQPA